MPQKNTLSHYLSKRQKTIQIFIKTAIKTGCKVELISQSDALMRISKGNRSLIIHKARLPFQRKYKELSTSKSATKKILQEIGISVSKGIVAKTFAEAKKGISATSMKKPWIVKPIDGAESKGVVWNIQNYEELREGISQNSELQKRSGKFIVEEEFTEGSEHRILMLDNKVIACMEKIPPQIICDGKNTIESLVKKENKQRKLGNKILYNLDSKQIIERQGFTPKSIPNHGKIIKIQDINTVAFGGLSIDRTRSVSAAYKKIAKTTSELMGYSFLAVDIFTKDITEKSPTHDDYVVIEVNAAPAYYRCEKPYVSGKNSPEVSKILVKHLLEKSPQTKIPIEHKRAYEKHSNNLLGR